MAWTQKLQHFLHGKDRESGGKMMDALTVAVNRNYFTFVGWSEKRKAPETTVQTLSGKLCENYDTFRQWNS